MASDRQTPARALTDLAVSHGLQLVYTDMEGRRRRASREVLLKTLMALDPVIDGPGDVAEALRRRRIDAWRSGAEPVQVAWDGKLDPVRYNMAAPAPAGKLAYELRLETGQILRGSVGPKSLRVARAETLGGRCYEARLIPIRHDLPPGYHQLFIEEGERRSQTLVVAAPRRAWRPAGRADASAWGVFAPLYALRSRRSLGAGDLTDLETLMEWAAGLGARVTATLPLMAAFMGPGGPGQPYDPSPYVPASRLFWNEFYIDVGAAPELARCAAARALLESAAVQEAAEALREDPLIDYRLHMALKRSVLQALTRCFFDGAISSRRDSFEHFLAQNPRVEDYAAFRAACEKQRSPWPDWPEPLRGGTLIPGDYDEKTKQYYVYTQWLIQEQLGRLSERARALGPGLYLDLPLGAHPEGYDVWRERESFALGISGGAPPDDFFRKGQLWGFPPPHPEKIRARRYDTFIEMVAGLARRAGVLRVDHVMGLYRLFWTPAGMEATEGLYASYRGDELTAILCLESHRNRSMIVGEDLGTVPRAVRGSMERHNLSRMAVLQFNVTQDFAEPIRPIPSGSVASLNTHDTPTFAGFWRGLDIDDQVELGLIDRDQAEHARQERARKREALVAYFRGRGQIPGGWGWDDPAILPAIFEACLRHLAISPARLTLVTLEDLWQEAAQQNTPGTYLERPNWRRRAAHSLDSIMSSASIRDFLRQIDGLRRGHPAGPGAPNKRRGAPKKR